MTVLASVIVICAAAVFVWSRYERVIRERHARALAIEEQNAARALAIEERKLALEERKAKGPPAPIEIPGGLLRLAESESEEWAKEQVKARIRELYAELGRWDDVAQIVTQEVHGRAGGDA